MFRKKVEKIIITEIFEKAKMKIVIYLLSTPPNREAFKHSGGDSLRWTSPTVTLYFDVELSNDRRPGTLQNTSEGVVDIPTTKNGE